MRLQFLVDGDEDGSYEYLTIYLDETHIIGFFVPDDILDYVDRLLNIVLSNGDRYTVIITKELTDFLDIKFKIK